MTLIFEGKVRILSSVLRMGVGGSRVDNASSGGIFCGIDDNGRLKDKAYDVRANVYDKHPQGAVFSGCHIPRFDACKELVVRLAPRFAGISKLCSWDLAVGRDGSPILIEVNLTYGQIDFHQLCNGPVFGELTPAVADMVFNRRKQ